jgi:hypothetical protein
MATAIAEGDGDHRGPRVTAIAEGESEWRHAAALSTSTFSSYCTSIRSIVPPLTSQLSPQKYAPRRPPAAPTLAFATNPFRGPQPFAVRATKKLNQRWCLPVPIDHVTLFAKRENLMLKPQDLVVAAALGAGVSSRFESLADGAGLSLSECHAAMKRLIHAGLVSHNRDLLRAQFVELISHAARYVWPLEEGPPAMGMRTGIAAPMFSELADFPDPPDLPPVWPTARNKNSVFGVACLPLYPSVPQAARRNPALYSLLALIDAARARTGARERNAAIRELKLRLGMSA